MPRFTGRERRGRGASARKRTVGTNPVNPEFIRAEPLARLGGAIGPGDTRMRICSILFRRLSIALLAGLVPVVPAAAQQPAPGSPVPPAAAEPPEDGQWTMPAKNYASTRYSDLAE